MAVSASFATLVTLPVIIDEPGQYVTRCGATVTIASVAAKAAAFGCSGTYSSGVNDRWHCSGRLYFGQECPNDIVRKL